jgi:hypothetical protein
MTKHHFAKGRVRPGVLPGWCGSGSSGQPLPSTEAGLKWGSARIWKAFRAVAIFVVIGYTAMLAVPRAQADPISFVLDGKLEAGTDPTTPLPIGASASLPVSFVTRLPDGDKYEFFGLITGRNTGGANFGAEEPFVIKYVGNDRGGVQTDSLSEGPDTLTVHVYHAWQSRISTFNTTVGTRATLSHTALGSSAEETLNLGGQTTTFGPFSATVSEQLKSYTATISDPVIEDDTYVTTFGAGSPVGAFISYHGLTPPAGELPSTKASEH